MKKPAKANAVKPLSVGPVASRRSRRHGIVQATTDDGLWRQWSEVSNDHFLIVLDQRDTRQFRHGFAQWLLDQESIRPFREFIGSLPSVERGALRARLAKLSCADQVALLNQRVAALPDDHPARRALVYPAVQASIAHLVPTASRPAYTDRPPTEVSLGQVEFEWQYGHPSHLDDLKTEVFEEERAENLRWRWLKRHPRLRRGADGDQTLRSAIDGILENPPLQKALLELYRLDRKRLVGFLDRLFTVQLEFFLCNRRYASAADIQDAVVVTLPSEKAFRRQASEVNRLIFPQHDVDPAPVQEQGASPGRLAGRLIARDWP